MSVLGQLIVIGVGGGLGAILRFLIATPLNQSTGAFPLGTLAVNLTGAFFIGVLAAIFERFELPTDLRLFLFVGILGGYTTFSSFGLETARLIEQGHTFFALLYVLASNLIGILLVFAGMEITRAVVR